MLFLEEEEEEKEEDYDDNYDARDDMHLACPDSTWEVQFAVSHLDGYVPTYLHTYIAPVR